MLENEKEPETKIIVELGVVNHIIQRIDHYLYKKWPDLFIEENLKDLKKDFYNKYDEVIRKSHLIESRFKEQEIKINKKCDDLQVYLKKQQDRFEDLFFSKKKWYQFWKR